GLRHQQRLPVRGVADPVGVEAVDLLIVTGDGYRDNRVLPGQGAPTAQWQLVEHRVERVGEPRRTARDRHIVDERVAGGELVVGEHLAGEGVDHSRVTGLTASDEQPALRVELQADRLGAWSLTEDLPAAGHQTHAVDRAVSERSDVGVREGSDLDALGLETVRQVDCGREDRSRSAMLRRRGGNRICRHEHADGYQCDQYGPDSTN